MPEHPYEKFIWAVSSRPADMASEDADDTLLALFTGKGNAERFADLMRETEPRSTYRVVPI